MQPIVLYSVPPSPNPWKVAIILEELKLPYKLSPVAYGDLKKSPFTDVNPNGRVPAIEDPNTGIVLWESNAIVEYLLDKYDKDAKLSYTTEPEKYHQRQWSYFQASGQGPYFGQAAWFLMFHPEPLPSAKKRYTDEVKRVVKVLDGVLENKASSTGAVTYLVGDKCTYADLTFVMWDFHADQWMRSSEEIGWNLDDYPHFKKWHETLMARESVKKIMEDRKNLLAPKAS